MRGRKCNMCLVHEGSVAIVVENPQAVVNAIELALKIVASANPHGYPTTVSLLIDMQNKIKEMVKRAEGPSS